MIFRTRVLLTGDANGRKMMMTTARSFVSGALYLSKASHRQLNIRRQSPATEMRVAARPAVVPTMSVSVAGFCVQERTTAK